MVGSILPLSLHQVEVRKRGKRLLGPVSVAFPSDGFTMVMGPNGAGKSTLLKTIHGLERTAAGQIEWNAPQQVVRARQAFVFQSPVIMRRTTRENVAYPMIVRGMQKRAASELAQSWLERVGLADAAERRARVLSGGERQKMALARALITDPELLFLDEPCANLDGSATREIEHLLQTAHTSGIRVIMATHDIGQARRLATDVVFLHKGQVQEHTPAPEFFENPQSGPAKAYLNGDIVE